ncbi:uncharacterized protein LOC108745118 isoform X2 [Agrilus planipennis]|uniref:Uncharacterized protein LOC108745118 isoform X2 n=1 Tax=Agrilus planipennis TaxID=224129 RepID=A0A1W4XKT2_AGRPL|nr:uncharacterized protein LOC108745118 isoform X2 [Agrilus planipennis]XP_025834271.1 uncharacterized protein LOC108745118 isoform X2 [Agrilus planipennis]
MARDTKHNHYDVGIIDDFGPNTNGMSVLEKGLFLQMVFSTTEEILTVNTRSLHGTLRENGKKRTSIKMKSNIASINFFQGTSRRHRNHWLRVN